jgi:hypothetical protein
VIGILSAPATLEYREAVRRHEVGRVS